LKIPSNNGSAKSTLWSAHMAQFLNAIYTAKLWRVHAVQPWLKSSIQIL
jgi:hypothetical protein